MAKSKKPAAKKRGGTTGKNSAAKSAAAKSAASAAVKSSASAAAAKASSVAAKASSVSADAKESVAKASTAVSPSEMKKQLESSSKPLPEVAKKPAASVENKEKVETETKAEKTPAEKTPVKKEPAEKAAVAVPPPPAEPASQRSGFLPLFFGGVVAAGLGYLASEMNFFGTRGASDDLRTSVEAQDTRLSALESAEVDLSSVDSLALQVAGSTGKLEELGAEIGNISGQLETLQSESTAMVGRLDEINTRLTDVEKRPITENESTKAAVAAYQRELAALTTSITEQRSELQSSIEVQRSDLQSAVDAQRAEIESLLDNAITVEEAAAEAARVASIQKALTALSGAINSGEPFDAPLADLAEQGVEDVPAALSEVAAEGVQTLSALQNAFPDNARASLGAARASGEPDEEEAGLGGFLRRQLGARSVTPREGNGPDAVLSRAEAAVREGRLSEALAETEALPAPAKEAMQDWLDAARARDAAQAATEKLSQSLTAN